MNTLVSHKLAFPGFGEIEAATPKGPAEIEVPTAFKPIAASRSTDNMGDIWLLLWGVEPKAGSSAAAAQQKPVQTKKLKVHVCYSGDDVPEGAEFVASIPIETHSVYVFVSDSVVDPGSPLTLAR
ncbi:MAG: hypothetical protein ABSD52_07145 [Candidatus Cybelea sp.]|jgi:hypothetical protein